MIPATAADVTEAAVFIVAAFEPNASEHRMQMIVRMLRTRDYGRAEWMQVMRDLPFDPEASHNYGRGFNPADVERIVKRSRDVRARLTRSVTAAEMRELLDAAPDLDADDFHVVTYDARNEPLYRYAPNVKRTTPRPAPTPLLTDASGTDEDRPGGEGGKRARGPMRLADVPVEIDRPSTDDA